MNCGPGVDFLNVGGFFLNPENLELLHSGIKMLPQLIGWDLGVRLNGCNFIDNF